MNRNSERAGRGGLWILAILGFIGIVPYRLGLVALAILAGLYYLSGRGISATGLIGRKPPWAQWLIVLKYVVPLLLVSFGLGQLTIIGLSYIAPDFVRDAISTAAQVYRGPMFVVLALIAAPILEELLFRGIVFPLLARSWGLSLGLIGSSLLFGVFHLNVAGATLFGLVAGSLYARTSSLYLTIALHFLNNLVPVGLAELVPGINASPDLVQIREGLGSAIVFTLVGGAFMARFLWKNWPHALPEAFRPQKPGKTTEGELPPRQAA